MQFSHVFCHFTTKVMALTLVPNTFFPSPSALVSVPSPPAVLPMLWPWLLKWSLRSYRLSIGFSPEPSPESPLSLHSWTCRLFLAGSSTFLQYLGITPLPQPLLHFHTFVIATALLSIPIFCVFEFVLLYQNPWDWVIYNGQKWTCSQFWRLGDPRWSP